MEAKTIRLHNSRMSWRICWILCSFCLIISIVTKHHLFYADCYLLFAGIISFFYSLTIFAEIDKEGVTLFHRTTIDRKEKVQIQWSEIKKITYEKIKKKFRTKNMGIDTGLFAPADLEDHEGLLFELNEPITKKALVENNRKLQEKYYFKLECDRMIFIDKCPEGGFNQLFQVLKQFGGGKVISNSFKNQKPFKINRLYIDLIISFLTITLKYISL